LALGVAGGGWGMVWFVLPHLPVTYHINCVVVTYYMT